MNTNGYGGWRDDDRPEHPTQHDDLDRGQSEEPPAEWWEAREDETVSDNDMTPHSENTEQ